MSRLTRFALGLLLFCAALRALLFLVGAFFRLQTPLESFNPLEPKLVHLAWRAQHGVPLYPEWRDYPHVANFFGPVYFLVVGTIGRGVGASIEGLFAIGRTVTFTATLLTSLLVAGVLGRRYGLTAAVFGACVSLGAAPLDGFAVMTRPDVLAELFGFSGFLLAVGHRIAWVWVGGIVLALAVMTKQTAGAYAIAGVIALLAQHRPRRALGLALGVSLILAGAVAVLQFGFEPRFVDNLLGERFSPWSIVGWGRLLARLAMIGLELPLLAIVGMILWSCGDPRERSWAVLAAVQLAVSLVVSAKYGADLNYFLGLGTVAALAAGTLWDATWRSIAQPRFWQAGLGAMLVVLLTLESGLSLLQIQRILRADVPGYRLSTRRQLLAYRSLFRIAGDPSQRLLTDSGMLDIRQGERTVFADPWLFRVLVETGQIQTAKLAAMIDRQEFAVIVTTHDLFAADYANYDMGLPMALVERARTRYMPRGRVGGLFVSTPRIPNPRGGL
jgi:hypothetical protein